MVIGELPSNLGQIIGRLMLAAQGERLAPVSARARDLADAARAQEAALRAQAQARREREAREAQAQERARAEAKAAALGRSSRRAAAAKAVGGPGSTGGRYPQRRLALLRVLRGRWLSLSDIYAEVGGDRAALSVYMTSLKVRGWVQSRGRPGAYEYSATPAGEHSLASWERA